MADREESVLANELLTLLNTLEGRSNELKDPQYSAAIIDKGIAEARALVHAGRVTEARQQYDEVSRLLEQAEASARAHGLARKLMRIEFAYLLFLLALGYLTHKNPHYWLWAGFLTWHAGTAWFGALGGVTVGIFGIYSHIQQRNFDPMYELWYISKPIIGAIFGWFVVVVYVVGLIAVQGKMDINNRLLLYVMAFLAGFSERFTTRIIDQLMQVLTTWKTTTPSAPSGSSEAK